MTNNLEIIDSIEAFESAKDSLFADEKATGIIVTAELKWGNKFYSDLFGFDLIKDLRVTHQLKCPIIVVSNLPYEDFDFANLTEKKNGNTRFLKDPAVTFLPLMKFESMSSSEILLHFEKDLDNALYEDLCECLYHSNGFLDEVYCEFANMLRIKRGQYIELKEVDSLFNKIISLFLDHETEILSLKNHFLSSFDNFPKFEADLILKKLPALKKDIEYLLPHQEFVATESHKKNNYGEVLYIDNNVDLAFIVKEKLAKSQLKVIHAANTEEALEILKKDELNRITVVVCDYRFYSNEKFERNQGYHFLKEVARLPNLLQIITLSGLQSSYLANLTRKHMRSVIPMFKSDVFDTKSGFERFSLIVSELNQMVLNEIENSPKFNNKTFNDLYQAHRQSYNYESFEEDISSTASWFIREMKEKGRVPKYLLPTINGKLDLADSYKNLENFREVLLSRRMVLGLCQLEEEELKRGFENSKLKIERLDRWYIIYNALKNGELSLDFNKLPGYAEMNTVISRNLRFSIKRSYNYRLKKNISATIEEKMWLKKFVEELENV
ncbi:response regulator [Flexithrix dorotheae]|uniref:response regulator n=1 Tax=Flexithrix dorotheae TaxID=70993 RepID=UPI0003783AB8|nr:response regulator [Flexithrix dorotheae]